MKEDTYSRNETAEETNWNKKTGRCRYKWRHWYKRHRLQWFGHVEQMDNSRLPAKALATLVSGTRSQGRQRKRWIDNVKEDLYQRGSDVSQVVECIKDR